MDAFVTRRPKAGTQSQGQNSLAGQEPKERPAKRQKKQEIPDSESDDDTVSFIDDGFSARYPRGGISDEEEPARNGSRPTEVENALPETQSPEEAIQEYEDFKQSQQASSDDGGTEQKPPLWIKGRKSIYVDAFNLALDTVLEEESNLFDDKERNVFQQWRELDYEAQFMLVCQPDPIVSIAHPP